MIDLVGKCVPNVEGELRDLFIAECGSQGIKPFNGEFLKRCWKYLCVLDNFPKTIVGGQGDARYNLKVLTLQDFKPSVPSWNNKTPCEMTKEEALEFISDRFDGVEMEFRSLPFGDWCSACMTPLGIVRDSLYRIKPQPTEQQIKIVELEATIKKAQEQIEELKKLLTLKFNRVI